MENKQIEILGVIVYDSIADENASKQIGNSDIIISNTRNVAFANPSFFEYNKLLQEAMVRQLKNVVSIKKENKFPSDEMPIILKADEITMYHYASQLSKEDFKQLMIEFSNVVLKTPTLITEVRIANLNRLTKMFTQ